MTRTTESREHSCLTCQPSVDWLTLAELEAHYKREHPREYADYLARVEAQRRRENA